MNIFCDDPVMAKQKRIQSSCSLTRKAHGILQSNRGGFSVKAMLSVGLELFDALPAQEQKARTIQATEEDRLARLAAKEQDEQVVDEVQRQLSQSSGSRPGRRRRKNAG